MKRVEWGELQAAFSLADEKQLGLHLPESDMSSGSEKGALDGLSSTWLCSSPPLFPESNLLEALCEACSRSSA